MDGRIPEVHTLVETPTSGYKRRTEWNVRDSDGTIIFTLGYEVTGGSLKTSEFTEKHRKPCLHVPSSMKDVENVICDFVRGNQIQMLNIAGSREGKDPGIYE